MSVKRPLACSWVVLVTSFNKSHIWTSLSFWFLFGVRKHSFCVGSCCSIFSFLCRILSIVVCLFVRYLLAIACPLIYVFWLPFQYLQTSRNTRPSNFWTSILLVKLRDAVVLVNIIGRHFYLFLLDYFFVVQYILVNALCLISYPCTNLWWILCTRISESICKVFDFWHLIRREQYQLSLSYKIWKMKSKLEVKLKKGLKAKKLRCHISAIISTPNSCFCLSH